MAIGCGAGCAKIILIIYNIVFLLTGIVLIVLGSWLIADGTINDFVKLTYNGTNSTFFRDAAAILIAMGCFVLLVSVFGLVATILENVTLLVIYLVFLIIVFCGEIAGGVVAIVYKDRILYSLTTILDNSLVTLSSSNGTTHYYNYNQQGGNTTSNYLCQTSDQGYVWDFIQFTFQCCGVDAGSNSGYQTNPNYNFQNMCSKLKSAYYPLSCYPPINASTTWGQFHTVPDDEYAAQALFNFNNRYTEGCENSVAYEIGRYEPVLIGIGIGFAMLELYGIIFTVCLCRNTSKDEGDACDCNGKIDDCCACECCPEGVCGDGTCGDGGCCC